MIKYKSKANTRSMLCKAIKIPVFVPPVLILVNIYVIMTGPPCQIDDSNNTQLGHSLARDNVSKVIDEEKMKQKSINDQRLAHISKICTKYEDDEKFRNMKMTGEVIATPDKSFIYCDVPKVGCTHWKQVFRYLTHDYEGNVDSPEEIPRIYAHFGPWNKTSLIKLNNKTTVSELNRNGFKFMMSRDPYERLWSGYLDKLFLPDFWWWLGTKMVSEVRPGADDLSKKCGHDITFSEFLEFTAIHLRQGKHVDMHFEPMHRRCNPCQLNFHVIGKIETFSPDSKLILDKVKIKKRSKRSATTTDRSLEEIKMLTRYNFDIQNRLTSLGKKKECYNQVEIAYRLWKTFQYNGYIGDDLEFPEEEIANIQGRDQIKEALLSKFIAIRKQATRDSLKQWKEQRQSYVKKAYENIPRHIVEAIRDEYMKDFELFQYEKEPEYIFRR